MPKPGPKPRFGVAADVVLRVRVTPQQRVRLQQVAALNLTTTAGVIRQALESYVADFSDDPMFTAGPSEKE